jgi:O-antigen ligase
MFALVMGVFLSYSRGGLAALMLALATVSGLTLSSRKALLLALAVLLVPGLFLSWQEIRAPGERFATDSVESLVLDSRLPVWNSGVRAFADHATTGTGYGTFEIVFAQYRSPEVRARWTHAHNDWLQVFLEGGILTGCLTIVLVVLIIRTPFAVALRDHESAVILKSIAASLVVVSFYSFLDFTLRIPGAAVLGAFLVGLTLGCSHHLRAHADGARDQWPRSIV